MSQQQQTEGLLDPQQPLSEGRRYTGKHPIAATFHILFKIFALLVYLFCDLFNQNGFVTNFVIITLLLTFDFWTVKNITGRLLVGLRWWNEVKEDGSNEWIFESASNREVHQMDKVIFWGGLAIPPVLWGLFALACLLRFSFQWLLVVLLALTLNCANIVGYMKCNKDAKKKLQAAAGVAGFSMLGRLTNVI